MRLKSRLPNENWLKENAREHANREPGASGFFSGFDTDFNRLPAQIQRRIEAKIDEMGARLKDYPHYRMTGGNRYRLRIGDYRIIYTFDIEKQEIYLLAVGHRREVYR